MNLRQARIDDHWRHVYSRDYPTRLVRLGIRGIAGFGDVTIDFSGGLNAIVGSNGVGKSTLVAAIAQLLASDPNSSNSFDEGYRARLRGSSIEGIAFSEKREFPVALQDGENGSRIHVGEKFEGDTRWLDPSALANRCLHQIQTDKNFNDLLEPLAPLELDQDGLEIASYLVGKNYNTVQIYEITDYAGFDRFPYFRVSSGGVNYGSEGMGRGEFSLLLGYWTLRDMPKNSILILEEPETHVSPRSQDCLMNIVAKFCDEMGIWVVVTTHSPTVISRIPRQHIKLLVRGVDPTAVIPNPTKLDIALLLGGGIAHSGVILVEDQGAKDFLRSILEKLDSEMLRQFEIVNARSESNITNILRLMPTTKRWLTLIGAYDGDMRGRIDQDGFQWACSFLPGDFGPDQLLSTVPDRHPGFVELIAAELGMEREQVRVALNHVAGADHHDYFGNFAAALNLQASAVRRGFARIWLQNENNLSAAKEFITEIRNATQQD